MFMFLQKVTEAIEVEGVPYHRPGLFLRSISHYMRFPVSQLAINSSNPKSDGIS